VIALELDCSDEWKSETDWQEICLKSLNAAIAQTHFGDLATKNFDLSVSVNLSRDLEVQRLNKEWRGKDKPTNVLSFPMMEANELGALANTDDGEVLLGDMILAYETCASEADQKNIPIENHATHLIVHGMLHLLGYDHMDDAEADAMEALEIKALASLGLPNPYSELP
jgi:probable rRNA maturation factor